MKIISKYNDFYDSFGFTLGKPDESIVYVRKTEYLNNNDTKKICKMLDKYHAYEWSGYTKKQYRADLTTIIVGIYPYIYICPFYVLNKLADNHRYYPISEIKPIPVYESDIINKDCSYINEKLNKALCNYLGTNKCDLYISELYSHRKYWVSNSSYSLINNSWKIEDRDIFRELKVPIFYYINERSELHGLNYIPENNIVLNPIFTKQPFDIIAPFKNEIVNNMNIYIDIENFLWEIKQEPEANPDNNTKIINAGFDTKTSFRKM